jgi:outer membrane protein
MKRSLLVASVLVALLGQSATAEHKKPDRTYPEQEWAIGMALRTATIHFATDERDIATLVPMIFYEGKYVYARGITLGLHFWEPDRWQFSAFGRRRYFDIPFEYQNLIQGDTVDFGLQARYFTMGITHADAELMSDPEGHVSANFRFGAQYIAQRFRFWPALEAKFKTKHYNSTYFGLNEYEVDPGIDLAFFFYTDWHAWKSLYLMAMGKITYLDSNVRGLEIINRNFHQQYFLGIGLSSDDSRPKKRDIGITPYWRLAHGWATPSALADIIVGKAAKDEYNNQMTSIFYGWPLTNELFGLPLDFYLTGGFVWHHKSDVQTDRQEVVLAIKLYYTIPLPWRLRLGAAEGVSYVNAIPYVENTKLREKGYIPSHTLNFLDFSVDVNLGDIFRSGPMKHWWLGYSIHHRSAIFESAQQFGRIKGGSNFQSVYLQWNH